MSSKHKNGFTLAELLIVISLVLLVTLIAIPNLSGRKIQANENSAAQSLRAIAQAEIEYETRYPAHGFACSLPALGGSPKAGAASPTQAQLLPPDLAAGQKSGYTFIILNCTRGNANHGDEYTRYEAIAVPQTPGKTGHRGFCIDQTGGMKFDPAGGTNCTQSVE